MDIILRINIILKQELFISQLEGYQTTMLLVHKHLIVRAEVTNPPKDVVFIKDWFKQLVDKIGMKIMIGPIAEYCHMKGNRGLTCIAVIETSHIALHTWDEVSPSIIQLDVYSCGHFKIDEIIAHLSQFNPTKVEYKYLDREHDLKLISECEESCGLENTTQFKLAV